MKFRRLLIPRSVVILAHEYAFRSLLGVLSLQAMM